MSRAVAAWLRRGAVGWVALLSWAVTLLLGVVLVRSLAVNPLTTHGVGLPLAIGIPLGAVVFAVAARTRARWLTGVAVGGYAGWAGTTIAAALVGTPFGYGALSGDPGRMSALVMHFSTTWHPTDAADPHLAPEYPPLYPMLLGRIAAWTGRPGWQLLQPAQIVITSLAVVAAFLMWRRLVDDVPAFLASTTVFVSMVEPGKTNEILALAVYLPWLLATFAVAGDRVVALGRRAGPDEPDRPRALHPVASGVVIGLIVPWSPQVLLLSLVALLALAGHTWWTASPDVRPRLLARWGVTVLVAFVLASWEVVPLVLAYASGKTQMIADLWPAGSLVSAPFTIIAPGPLLISVLQTVGLVSLAAQLRRTWWAAPMAIYVVGVLAERLLMLIRFTGDGHAFMLYYVGASLSYALDVAGVLTVVQLWRWAAPRLAERGLQVRLTALTLVSLLVGTTAYSAYGAWVPSPRGLLDNEGGVTAAYSNAMLAHAEPLPSGRRVRYPAPRPANATPAFPTDAVVAFVRQSLGPATTPDVLSDNQTLFAFQAWPDWLMPGRSATSSLTRWDYRHGLLVDLARTTDPAAMAAGLEHLQFGPVDVLVLRVVTPAAGQPATWNFDDVAFDPRAFSGPQFRVSQPLGQPLGQYVVVARA